jgi:formate hydrogenlyase transcriptional activator
MIAMQPPDPPDQDRADSTEHDHSEFVQLTLESLCSLSPDAVLVTDIDGVIRASNLQAAALFGHTRAELTGKNIEILIPKRLRDRHHDHRGNYNSHPRARYMGTATALVALRKNGTEFTVDIMLNPLESDSGPLVLSSVRDVTEQQASHKDLWNIGQQVVRSIVESIRDYAIFLIDRDGIVTTWNTGGEFIKGYTTEEAVGLHFSQFFTEEDIARGWPANLMRLAALRDRVEDEGWRLRKDGSRFWADSVLTSVRDASGAVSGYAKVTRDVTDRKRVEESVMLQLSKALLDHLDARKLLGAISTSIRELIPHDSATLDLYDNATGTLVSEFLGPDGDEPRPCDIRLPLETSPAGAAIRTREPVLMDRLIASGSELVSPYDAETVRHLTGLGMQSGCWVPLIHRGEAIGALGVGCRSESAFTQCEAGMLFQIAGQIAVAVDNTIAFRRVTELRDKLQQEKLYLEEEINVGNHFEDIVGASFGLRHVLNDIATVAPTDATVLIQGETGTGKELLARAIHRLSPRKDLPFIKLNCAAIPDGLLESELFGHEKGAFTGAITRKLGRIELAQGGTLFLDEVGDLPLDLQPKLLRALQEREIERLGGTRPIKVNVRIIAASNRDLATMVAEKQFRADLFYRLKVFPVFSPSLRDRVDDIPLLVRHFVAIHSRRLGKTIDKIPEATMEALKRWKWPGNIRELENFLERAVILTRGSVLYVPRGELAADDEIQDTAATDSTHEGAERIHMLHILREAKGHISGDNGAAARLGLKRTTLNSKLKKLGIARSDYM